MDIEADVDANQVARVPIDQQRYPWATQWNSSSRVDNPDVQERVVNFDSLEDSRTRVSRKAVTPLIPCVCLPDPLAVTNVWRNLEHAAVDGFLCRRFKKGSALEVVLRNGFIDLTADSLYRWAAQREVTSRQQIGDDAFDARINSLRSNEERTPIHERVRIFVGV